MRVTTAWQAMDQAPVRFLRSAWPWRSLLYLVSGVLWGAVLLVVGALLLAGTVVFLVVGVGLVLGVALVALGIGSARLERRRLRLVDLDEVPDPHRAPLEHGVLGRLRARLRERATWRDLGFTGLCATALFSLDATVLLFAVALPVVCFRVPFQDPTTWPWVLVGIAVLAAAPYTVTAWAGARAALTRTVLGPRDSELGADLGEVEPSRARLLTAFDAERSRIERDLHDGAQQRLVALNVRLGLIRVGVADHDPVAADLDSATRELRLALTELRDLVRGLRPPLLADHGLAAAIADHAGGSPVPIEVDVHLPHRLPAHVESTAYFVFTEAIANVIKHSRATSAAVFARQRTDTLVLEVTDNGVGGATPSAGSGLGGLAERLTVVDGRIRLSSPVGGPTLLRVEIPCRFE